MWGFTDFAKHFGGAGLIETNPAVDQANGFEQVQGAYGRDLRCGAGLIEADTDKALSRQIVNLVGLSLLHERDAGAQVRQVIFDQMKIRVVLDAQLINSPEVNRAGTSVGAINSVPFFQ